MYRHHPAKNFRILYPVAKSMDNISETRPKPAEYLSIIQFKGLDLMKNQISRDDTPSIYARRN